MVGTYLGDIGVQCLDLALVWHLLFFGLYLGNHKVLEVDTW